MLRVGFISYLPDADNRDKRIRAIRATLEDARQVIPADVIIDVIAQNYKDDIVVSGPGFNYIHYDEGIGQCAARNELLRRFYESDDDFLLYSDDDTTFYDRYGAVQLFQALHDNPSWFKDVDCFTGLEGRFTPFTEENAKLGLEDKWVFKPMQFATSGEFRVIRNVRKYYRREFFYDSNLKYGEDLHFRLTKLSQINSFVCRNVICRSRGMGDDLCTLDTMTQLEQEALYRKITLDIYEQVGVKVTESGKPDLTPYRCKIPYLAVYAKDGSSSTSPGPRTKRLF